MSAHSPQDLHLRTAPASRPPRSRCRADTQDIAGQRARQVRQRKGRHRQHLHRVHFTSRKDQGLPDRRQMSPCVPAEREVQVDSRISDGPRLTSV